MKSSDKVFIYYMIILAALLAMIAMNFLNFYSGYRKACQDMELEYSYNTGKCVSRVTK